MTDTPFCLVWDGPDAGTGLSPTLVNILDELEVHREALKRAGLLKP